MLSVLGMGLFRLQWFRSTVIYAGVAILCTAGVALRLGLPVLRHAMAVSAIRMAGGQVWIVGEGRKWLHELAGADVAEVFGSVKAIEFDVRDQVATSKLRYLQDLPETELLSMKDSVVTDRELGYLRNLTHLSSLSLAGTLVTDSGLAKLTALPTLKMLSLRQTGITDAGLHHIYRMRRLETVDLTRTHVTESGLNRLRRERPDVLVLPKRSREM